MLKKQHLLTSIAAMAQRLGRAPSLLEFVASAEIPKNSIFRLFPRWNDAVMAAGLQPHRLYLRPEDHELLTDWGETVRDLRTMPSRRAYNLNGKYYPLTLEKRFGGWQAVPRAFRNFAKGKREWADVLALTAIPALDRVVGARDTRARQTSKSSHSPIPPKQIQRAIYVDPPDLPTLCHEPVNEQGVVLLFGMLAKDLGYVVESVQAGFPDCEAKRRVGPKRWQRVNIEFEFESKNFRDHGHPLAGCDVIVCWRHNWPDCPRHIEVLDLSTRIRSFAKSGD